MLAQVEQPRVQFKGVLEINGETGRQQMIHSSVSQSVSSSCSQDDELLASPSLQGLPHQTTVHQTTVHQTT